MFKYLFSLVLCLTTSLGMAQQNFSCSYGARGACLGYSDKVVDQNSQCFSSGTCGYSGFICKSKYDDLVGEYDTLVRNFNENVRKNKSLIDTAEECLSKNSTLVSDYNDLLEKYKRLNADWQDKVDELRRMTVSYNQLLAIQRTKK